MKTRLHLAIVILSSLASTSLHAVEHVPVPSPDELFQNARQVMQTYPHIAQSMTSSKHNGFGGEASRAIANHMVSRDFEPALKDAAEMLDIEAHGKGTWFLRWPWVNSVVFETSEGLVLVDTGHAPAGPTLVKTLSELSNKPIHTVIFSHSHIDHAYGAWAIEASGQSPRYIASTEFRTQMGLDIQLADFTNAAMNNQSPEDVPRSWTDMVQPTETFYGRLEIEVGGETFVLFTARGETEDHVWVYSPERNLVVSGDLQQPFLPNAGNGKRRQRHVQEWAEALRNMAAFEPELVLPLHGDAIKGGELVQEKLQLVARAFESIVDQVVDGLNQGYFRDDVIHSVALPEDLQNHPDLDTYYNTPTDIARMVMRDFTGWWDGTPANWQSAPERDKARAIVELGGGLDAYLPKVRATMKSDIVMASHMADWAYYAAPEDPRVLQLGLDVYSARVKPGMPVNQISVYMMHMAELMWRQQKRLAN